MIVKTFRLNFYSQIYQIPSNTVYLDEIDQKIYKSLISKQYYEVKTKVNNQIFESFIKYLIKKQIPDITPNNICEYNLLSLEFDIMKNIIQIFLKISSKKNIQSIIDTNKEKRNRIQSQNFILNQKNTKYQQVIYYIFNNTRKEPQGNFLKFKEELLLACENEDVEMVDLLTRPKIEYKGISYILDHQLKRSTLFHNISATGDIQIPKSIKYSNNEYLITTITENSFKSSQNLNSINFTNDSQLVTINKHAFMFSSLEYICIPSSVTMIGEGTFSYCRRLKKIDFFENSQLKTICKYAFSGSSINNLSIPSSVTDLRNGWCRGTAKLTEISIIQNNVKNISNYKDSFIIGKSDLTNEYFDVLFIARRDIQKVAIPSFIRKIGQYAFDECKQIQSIKFSSDSKLKSIDNYAFFNSSLESISIPRKVANIGDFAFSFCNQLRSIEFCQNSKLSLIENYAFSDSSLEKIFIPSHVTRIGKYAFSYCRNFRNVDFADNSELEIIDENAFYMSSIIKICIPPKVAQIKESAFCYCSELKNVDFSKNKEMCLINKYAFSYSSIENLFITPNIINIDEYAFHNCKKLQIIEFDENSRLNSISKEIFGTNTTVIIMIPFKISKLIHFNS